MPGLKLGLARLVLLNNEMLYFMGNGACSTCSPSWREIYAIPEWNLAFKRVFLFYRRVFQTFPTTNPYDGHLKLAR